jgi:hypothetical protein
MSERKTVPTAIPQATMVQWVGLCPCGCGTYTAVLVDDNDKCIATFGWDREGWVAFTKGVILEIDGESNEAFCEHHTAH